MTDIENMYQIHKNWCLALVGDTTPSLRLRVKELLARIGAKLGVGYQAPVSEINPGSYKLVWPGFTVEFYQDFSVHYRMVHVTNPDIRWEIDPGNETAADIISVIQTHFSR